jgi:hypothetical protein
MAVTVQAMAASVATIGAALSVSYFQPAKRLRPLPLTVPMLARARLRLHRLDLMSYIFAASGTLTLIPEAMQIFAPELMSGGPLSAGLEHLDYITFVLFSLSFGMGLARRLLHIQLEKASLQPCP